MCILGLSFFYHDSAAALVLDGVPVVMSEEERFSRKKHDSGFPHLAIEFVLREAGIRAKDLDYVVFYEKPFVKTERILKTALSSFPGAPFLFARSMKNTFTEKLWIREYIRTHLDIDAKKICFSSHHLSHAASAFFCSPYEKAAVLTVDGVGEWATTAIGIGKKNNIKILKEMRFPHSLGLLYSAFTAFLGFEVNEGEYKVMGMAPYGKPVYKDKVWQTVKKLPNGGFEFDLSYFSFHRSAKRTYTKKFIELFGKPRTPGSKFFTRATDWPSYFGEKPEAGEYEKLAREQEHYANIASSLQSVTEEVLLHLAREARRLTGEKVLCYAGGVALNSVANSKIALEAGFEDVFIQPSAGDAGGALGAALALYHGGLGKERKFRMTHCYYGAKYENDEVESFLKERNIRYREMEDAELMEYIAGKIEEGKVIGWFDGRAEWGPRALGHRSILADPRREEMKDIVNTKIKFREPYRPFAPLVMEEYAKEYFESPADSAERIPAKFMLYVTQVRKEKQKEVGAITHVDGSARPQLVSKKESSRYHALIDAFREKTGIPMLLNTSFNLRGEPIVNSPENAYSTFTKSGLDLLVLGSLVVSKTQ